MTIGMVQKDLRFALASILHDGCKRAIRLAQLDPVGSHVVQQIIAARASNGLVGRVPSNAFCPLVPEQNDALTIHKVHPIIKIINDCFVEIIFVGHETSREHTANSERRINLMSMILPESNGQGNLRIW
jgi:hypothetical protein